MIVVVGRIRTDSEKRAEFLRIGQALAAASRTEAECISYRLYEDSETENDFVFLEQWANAEALERHFGTPHIREFMRAVPATVIAPAEVKFHTVASSRDLADMAAR